MQIIHFITYILYVVVLIQIEIFSISSLLQITTDMFCLS
jgi:hypothetical protein